MCVCMIPMVLRSWLHLQRPGQDVKHLLLLLAPAIFHTDQVIQWVWSSPFQLSLLDRKFLGAFCFYPLTLGLQARTARSVFKWVLGFRTHALQLRSKHSCPLRYLLSSIKKSIKKGRKTAQKENATTKLCIQYFFSFLWWWNYQRSKWNSAIK